MPHHQLVGWNFLFVVCRLNTTDNTSRATLGTKDTETDIHFCAYNFEMELISLFYKMYYIRPGLGPQCVIVIFPDHTHLFFSSLVEKEYKCTTADTESVHVRRSFFFCFFWVFFQKHDCK